MRREAQLTQIYVIFGGRAPSSCPQAPQLISNFEQFWWKNTFFPCFLWKIVKISHFSWKITKKWIFLANSVRSHLDQSVILRDTFLVCFEWFQMGWVWGGTPTGVIPEIWTFFWGVSFGIFLPCILWEVASSVAQQSTQAGPRHTPPHPSTWGRVFKHCFTQEAGQDTATTTWKGSVRGFLYELLQFVVPFLHCLCKNFFFRQRKFFLTRFFLVETRDRDLSKSGIFVDFWPPYPKIRPARPPPLK